MNEIAASRFQEAYKLSQTTLGPVAVFSTPPDSVIHKVYCHLLPNPDVVDPWEIDAEIQFFSNGVLICRLPAKVTSSPTNIFSNLFPVNAGGTTVAENTVSIAYQGDATSYVLYCRTVIATADEVRLHISNARNMTTGAQLAGLKFYFAIDSASLPF